MEDQETKFWNDWLQALHKQNETQIEYLKQIARVINLVGLLIVIGIIVQACGVFGL